MRITDLTNHKYLSEADIEEAEKTDDVLKKKREEITRAIDKIKKAVGILKPDELKEFKKRAAAELNKLFKQLGRNYKGKVKLPRLESADGPDGEGLQEMSPASIRGALAATRTFIKLAFVMWQVMPEELQDGFIEFIKRKVVSLIEDEDEDDEDDDLDEAKKTDALGKEDDDVDNDGDSDESDEYLKNRRKAITKAIKKKEKKEKNESVSLVRGELVRFLDEDKVYRVFAVNKHRVSLTEHRTGKYGYRSIRSINPNNFTVLDEAKIGSSEVQVKSMGNKFEIIAVGSAFEDGISRGDVITKRQYKDLEDLGVTFKEV